MANYKPFHPKTAYLGAAISTHSSIPVYAAMVLHNHLYKLEELFKYPQVNRSQVLPDYKRKRHRTRQGWQH